MAIDLKYCTVHYKRPVVILRFSENAELDVPQIREMISVVLKIVGNKPYLLLSDTRGDISITSEGRRVSAEESPLLIANAVLVNSLAVKLTANFFVKFNKPHFKVKLFNNEEKAMKWLLQFDPDKKTAPKTRGTKLSAF